MKALCCVQPIAQPTTAAASSRIVFSLEVKLAIPLLAICSSPSLLAHFSARLACLAAREASFCTSFQRIGISIANIDPNKPD
jgi:hypothetical protein